MRPMLQIAKDFYEDIDGPITERMIADLRAGKEIKPGPQNGRRISSEPEGGALTLTDPALFDGSVIGKHHRQVPEPAATAADGSAPTRPPGAAT